MAQLIEIFDKHLLHIHIRELQEKFIVFRQHAQIIERSGEKQRLFLPEPYFSRKMSM